MRKNALSWVLVAVVVISLLTALPLRVTAQPPEFVTKIVETNTEYETLGLALAAVTNGQTVRLLADVTYNGDISAHDAYANPALKRSFDIDLNGCTLTVNASNMACFYAGDGCDISISDSGEGGAVYANTSVDSTSALRADNVGSTITVSAPLTVNAAGSNSKGIYTFAGGVVTVSNATITATGNGVEAYGANSGIPSSITVTGDVTTNGVSNSGAYAYAGGEISVNGDLFVPNYGYGTYANNGRISVDGNVSSGGYGIFVSDGGAAEIEGDVSAVDYGAYIFSGGTIEISGDVSASAAGSYGAHVYNGGRIDVYGDVSGDRYGILAMYNGSTVNVSGNAVAAGGHDYYSAAAVAEGLGSSVNINGNATVTGSNGYGVLGNNGGKVSVGGNVKAQGNGSYGVCVNGYDNGSEVTVEGTIDATNYIKAGPNILDRDDNTTPTTKPGYLTYSGGTLVNTVWVKNLITSFAWAVEGNFPKGPVALQVPQGAMRSLATVGDGFCLTGADYAGEDLYGVGYSTNSSGLYKINAETGEYQLIGNFSANLQGLTYDAKNDVTYVISYDNNYALYTINLKDASMNYIGPSSLPSQIYAIADIAFDNQGHLYGLDVEHDALLSINTANGAVTQIGSIGLNLTGPQDLAYDRDNGILYGVLWDGDEDHGGIYRIDTATGAATQTSFAALELDAFAIPYINESAPFITITTQPATEKTVTKGNNSDTLSCAVTVSDGSAPAYAWYTCNDKNKTGATPLVTSTYPTAHQAELTIPTALPPGSYYYFCRVSADGAESVDSSVAKISLVNPSFTITASAGSHGSVTPVGTRLVNEHDNLTFTITPDYGYAVADVLVDGVSVGAVSTYTFNNVTANHTIAASFVHNCLAKQFKDVDISKWYHEGIDFVVLEGLFKGLSDTTFSPDATMTRAMLVTVLYRLEGEPATAAANPFHDVAANQWYTKAVIWAADKNIVKGYNATTFGTNDPITREQMATLLYRYAQYKGYDLSAGDNFNLSKFSDSSAVSGYAVTAMKWACATGILQGDNNKLRPGDNSTRAQVATMLMRFVKSRDT